MNRRTGLRLTGGLSRTLPVLLCLLAARSYADDLESARHDLDRARAELARQCAADGLVEESIREWQEVLRGDPQNAEARKGVEAAGKPWVVAWDDDLHSKFLACVARRSKLGDEFARRFLALDDPTTAVVLSPDFEEARLRLGFARFGSGWMPREFAEKRAAGLLPFDGKWLPAEEVCRKRAVWADAWEARGAHFVVRSNRSMESAREVLALAEAVYAGVHRELLAEVDPPSLEKLLPVDDFASRADYLAHLDAVHGRGDAHRNSPGFFSSLDGASHFAPLDDDGGFGSGDVMRHEIAHQVCDAAFPPEGKLAERPHFWAWEGMAGFFESLEVRDGKILVGDPRHPRLAVARRALAEGRTLPLEQFVKLEGEGLKGRYNQAAALTHFFMRAAGTKYREPFLKYFRVVASGKAGPDSFEKAFGRKPGEFEEEWQAFARGEK